MDHHHECLVPVLKVCYFRYCSLFDKIGPVFNLNMGSLEDVGWGSALTEQGPCQGVKVTVVSRTQPKWVGQGL